MLDRHRAAGRDRHGRHEAGHVRAGAQNPGRYEATPGHRAASAGGDPTAAQRSATARSASAGQARQPHQRACEPHSRHQGGHLPASAAHLPTECRAGVALPEVAPSQGVRPHPAIMSEEYLLLHDGA